MLNDENAVTLLDPTPIETGLVGARVTFTSQADRVLYGTGVIQARNKGGFIISIPGVERPLWFQAYEIEIIGVEA